MATQHGFGTIRPVVPSRGAATQSTAQPPVNSPNRFTCRPRHTPSMPGSSVAVRNTPGGSGLHNVSLNAPVSITHTTIVEVQTRAPENNVKHEQSPQKRPRPPSDNGFGGSPSRPSKTKTKSVKDYSALPGDHPVQPSDPNSFPCERKGPGKMRIDGESNVWILQKRLVEIERQKLTGKDFVREVAFELLSLGSAQSKDLLRTRSANGKGITALVSLGFLKAMKEYVRTEHAKGNNPKFDDLKGENLADLLLSNVKIYYWYVEKAILLQ